MKVIKNDDLPFIIKLVDLFYSDKMITYYSDHKMWREIFHKYQHSVILHEELAYVEQYMRNSKKGSFESLAALILIDATRKLALIDNYELHNNVKNEIARILLPQIVTNKRPNRWHGNHRFTDVILYDSKELAAIEVKRDSHALSESQIVRFRIASEVYGIPINLIRFRKSKDLNLTFDEWFEDCVNRIQNSPVQIKFETLENLWELRKPAIDLPFLRSNQNLISLT